MKMNILLATINSKNFFHFASNILREGGRGINAFLNPGSVSSDLVIPSMTRLKTDGGIWPTMEIRREVI
ncbi:MAG: hypothetical protein ABR863_07985 [Roseiarcus sp.]